ncbi:putative glycosyl hydrolase [Wickerhamomyces ciferrii]|uniref:alpha-1,2-Mannosidase n=1 Tax=Wickerhamomyces ciferrii (strain ATCC 14091 / BCRC 22168 / CBS 111 / JCM 3599 / NBRC 0793 / NRRL Y-1031 F-60-10) TaxID=1206466 RepID=K0KJL1_WICCF|nr:putative glycosyl hydrolase [Wickerhamomyces ciferrii]CCH42312.1 putative glycosyl hydrolase [Wickerhamomyces ciferrii]
MSTLLNISYLSYRFRKIRFFLLIAITLVGLFYYTFLNEEYELNQHADEDTLPRIINEHGEQSTMDLMHDDTHRDNLNDPKVLKQKNKYFPILEVEESEGRREKSLLPDEYFYNQKETNLRKNKKHWLYPIGKENLIKLPKLTKKDDYPGVQSTYFNDGGLKDELKLSKIKETFMKSWKLYKEHGYGHDEVRPISHKKIDPFNGWSSTIVDALDSLWIIDEKQEFEEAINFLKTVNFKQSFRNNIPIFENIIRVLGGLISGYDLSKEESLLNHAVEFADFLIEAFDTPNHMPMLYYKWQADLTNKFASRQACLAEVGSLSLEFSRLTQLTNDHKYYDAVARITQFFENSIDKFFMKGLVPNKIDISGCKLLNNEDIEKGLHLNNPNVIKSIFENSFVYCLMNQHFTTRQAKQEFSLGGLGDSYYEYMPKMYHLLRGDPKHAKVYKDLYLRALDDIKEYMLFQPKIPNGEDLLFSSSISVFQKDGRYFVEQQNDMQHLTCFAGGMFALGSRLFGRPDDLKIAEKLTMGCVHLYKELQIMPEKIHVGRMKSKDDLFDMDKRLDKIWFQSRDDSPTGDVRELTKPEVDKIKAKIISSQPQQQKSNTNPSEKVDKRATIKNDQDSHKEDPLYTIMSPNPDYFPKIEVIGEDHYIWSVGDTHNQPYWVNDMDPTYNLRPEAIESVFYMYRITGDSKWRDYGWMMFENIVKNCKNEDGEFASIRDITIEGNVVSKFKDRLESFWFSETLKYFYLLFDDVQNLNLDEYVLNTEAHPFKLVN